MTLPEFGTFSAFYERASFDPEEGVFYPSRIRIILNSHEDNQSSLLRDSLKRKLKIKEYEAQRLIDKFVEETSQKLNKTRYCKLEGIGYLINYGGKIILKDTFWKHNKYLSLLIN